ncbi:DUF488 domain-containing protein [Macrococcoides caseolyticum]|uniref:DUF488 domain-containing protein n=1 Tax=Macrococcoides caseolyticum TaxID=69966 RepID=A0A855GHK5_9STAP|nr:DUF488 family protein [Macrococcus caseolyticus]PKD98841.1 DUF488 domain-containing protein [Macrococcus caseolyticus]PKE19942.1 DUF488 domain-containing protein [Macrococcus caseolyticus]PKE21468.1 DUF488 domain-containing protein [Macrococcus caseolyticus]PKE25399.1 DUF488 domain-containing protein [Macrococcus caseolyticus]PKE57913.1 DUF488 domain-containing protein [Macrococcus caseolyticus]
MYKLARIYDEDIPKGKRVLVDRVWPRGISKEGAKLDEWLKDVAPSTDLRKWFNHDPDKFSDFKKKYKDELKDNNAVKELKDMKGTIVLLYGAKDEKHNHAVVLKEYMEDK